MPEEYQIGRSAGRCSACGRQFARGEDYFSALEEAPPPPAAAPPPAPSAGGSGGAGEAAPPEPPPSTLPYRRLDFCPGCWKPEAAEAYFSFWRTSVPDVDPDEAKPLARRIDADTVYEMFRRLEGQAEPERQRFRFILALILMRAKRLRFAGVAKGPQGDHLVLEDRAENITHKVRDPGLADSEIDSLRGEVGRLLRGEVEEPAAQ
jgi:hypothetical protein